MAGWWVVVMDHDKREFSIHGPLRSDGPMSTKVANHANATGRHLQCQVIEGDLSRARVLEAMAGFRFKEIHEVSLTAI